LGWLFYDQGGAGSCRELLSQKGLIALWISPVNSEKFECSVCDVPIDYRLTSLGNLAGMKFMEDLLDSDGE
jgi:hypothetical protein